MEKLKILLVGNEGYIGSGLQEALSEYYEIIGWNKQQDINSITTEILTSLNVSAVINASVVIDKTPATSIDTNSTSYKVNVEGVQTLVDALKPLNIPLFQLSTRDVFGDGFKKDEVDTTGYSFKPLKFFTETDETRPCTLYGLTKLEGEKIALSYNKSVVVRLSSPYTTNIHKNGGWLQKFVRASVKGDLIKLYGKGWQKRDPLHVWDIAQFIKLALEKYAKGLFHLGGPSEDVLTLDTIAHWLKLNVENVDSISDYGCVFNYNRANRELQWQPTVNLSWALGELKVKYENSSNV